MKSLEEHYALSQTTIGDIEEHIDDLYEYTKRCDSVLELGVRTVVSSWAFVKGLRDNGAAGKRRLLCVDLAYHENVAELRRVAIETGVDFDFIEKNDLELDLQGEEFDLTFIDTWHVYGHLKRELNKFAPSTRKYIIMHDTETDKVHGESIRVGWDTAHQAVSSNIPEAEIRKGLGPAITEFLEEHPEWVVELIKLNNNGLTVLSRRR
jgi:hypothetical protein